MKFPEALIEHKKKGAFGFQEVNPNMGLFHITRKGTLHLRYSQGVSEVALTCNHP